MSNDKSECPLCRDISELTFHHWEYPRKSWPEDREPEGVYICWDCHQHLHGGIDRRVTDQGKEAEVHREHPINELFPDTEDERLREEEENYDWRNAAVTEFVIRYFIERAKTHPQTCKKIALVYFQQQPHDLPTPVCERLARSVCAEFNIPKYLEYWTAVMFDTYIYLVNHPDYELEDNPGGLLKDNIVYWSYLSELNTFSRERPQKTSKQGTLS